SSSALVPGQTSSVMYLAQPRPRRRSFFFFNETSTTEIYTLSLHDALPIWSERNVDSGHHLSRCEARGCRNGRDALRRVARSIPRSEEHTSELQSRFDLVCRLLLEKKNYEHTLLLTTATHYWGRQPGSQTR